MSDGRRLFILIDALGWEHVQDLGFVPELAHRTAVGSVLGYSSAAIPAILSGRLPCENGQWSFFYRTQGRSPLKVFGPLSRLPKRAQSRRVRLAAQRWIIRRWGITGYFHTYEIPFATLARMDTCEHHSPFEPHGIRFGDSIIDEWCAKGVPHRVFPYPLSDDEIMTRALDAFDRSDATKILCYLTSWDAALHDAALASARVQDLAARYATFIRSLLERLGPQDRLAVFSDHGMTPVRQAVSVADALDAARPHLDACIVDSTMCRLWLRETLRMGQVREILSAVDGAHVLTEAEQVAYGLPPAEMSFGDLILLADPGVVFSPNHMGEGVPLGMHGYDPAEPSMLACALATDPLPELADITHLRALMSGW